jgi:hypothetical protein
MSRPLPSDLAPDIETRALAAWREHDVARSIHAADRDAIRATEAARALVLERLANAPASARTSRSTSGDPARDLYNACARLGRLLFEAGASPTLATTTIDGATQALTGLDLPHEPGLVASARASIAEGYVAAALDAERARARRAWEYPACAARIDGATAAIVAGAPEDDDEALGDWAARVASGASKDGIREVVVSGPPRARAELAEALALLGIEVRDPSAARRDNEKKTPWLRLPWRRKPRG